MPGRPHKKECAEREVQMKIAVEGVQDGTYMSIDYAVKALADLITNATVSGNPVTHSYIKEVAEGIRTSRTDITNEYLHPIGTTWLPGFFRRHLHLQTKLAKAMEMARVKDVTKEQIINFNQDFRRLIHEKNIKHDNIYNCDETGNLNDEEVS
jgi:hypothetical protein